MTPHLLLVLILLFLPPSILAQTLTGVIVSCSACKLNRYPHLKSFLKDYEAEEYNGVVVQFVPGKPAVLSIYSDGTLQEEIDLHQFASKDELHALMVEKGFVRMSYFEVQAMKERKAVELAEEQKRREARRPYEQQEAIKRRDAKMAYWKEVLKEKAAAGEQVKVGAGEEL
ncbi:Sep15/SelM redox domain containing protein [Fragilaria crotonensis]|nr:Sep15/SelM redox domain containing protein [Fragilaria crotonensis]